MTDPARIRALELASDLPSAYNAGHEAVLDAAEAYLRFLNGRPALAADPHGLPEPASVCPDPSGFTEGSTFHGSDGVIYTIRSGAWAVCGVYGLANTEDTELADLTESYPADEPVIALADSPHEPETGNQLEDWLLESAPAVAASLTIDGEAADVPLTVEEDSTVFVSLDSDAAPAFEDVGPCDCGYEDGKPVPVAFAKDEFGGHFDEAPEPTFEYVAEAVEQIAGSPPPNPDESDAPEMTDEQVERIEEQTAAALADEGESNRELEPAGEAFMRFPWFKPTV